jgi:phage-related protein
MANPTPWWGWCPQAGAARVTALTIDQTNYGDGYNQRATRGLNPARASWTLSFPFTSLADLTAMDAFLKANATTGFWMQPPDAAAPLFATADTWTATIIDKNNKSGIVGTLQVTMAQSFNPQPINAPPFVARLRAARR